MVLYFLVLTFFLFYIIPKKYHLEHENKVFLIFTFVFIFLMYGMRDVSVGIDTKSYDNYFTLYQNYSLKDLIFGNLWLKKLEPMFVVMAKLSSIISNDTHVFLIVSGLLYALLVTSLFAKLKEGERFYFAYLFYSMYIVCTGLNTMRQAFAIVLLAHAFLSFRELRRMKTLFFCILSVLFHICAILVAGVMCVYMVMGNNPKYAWLMKSLSIFAIVIGIVSYQFLFEKIGSVDYSSSGAADISMFNIILIALFMGLWMINKRKRVVQYNSEAEVLEIIMISTLICCVMGGFAVGFIRVTSVLLPMLCFSYTYIYCAEKSGNAMEGKVIIPLYTILYFTHQVLANIGGIVPFVIWEVG